jgi:hypothetical protein
MALAQRSSPALALDWFIGAPLKEKARWLGRGLKQPRSTAQWIAWQARSVAQKALRAGGEHAR